MTTSLRSAFDLPPCGPVASAVRCKRQRRIVLWSWSVAGNMLGKWSLRFKLVARYDMRYAYVALRSLRSLRRQSLRSPGCALRGLKGNGHGKSNSHGQVKSSGDLLGGFPIGEGF